MQGEVKRRESMRERQRSRAQNRKWNHAMYCHSVQVVRGSRTLACLPLWIGWIGSLSCYSTLVYARVQNVTIFDLSLNPIFTKGLTKRLGQQNCVAKLNLSLYPISTVCRTVHAWRNGRQKQVVANTRGRLHPIVCFFVFFI